MNEEPIYSDKYMLDRMCWLRAMSAERAYPPKQAANDVLVNMDDVEEGGREKMVTKMGEKLMSARDLFQQMEIHGHNPKRRAERYAKEQDKERPNWSWYDEK